MTKYYTYYPEHCLFDVSDVSRTVVNPTKLTYLDLTIVCWTDFEKCQEAVAGLMVAKELRLLKMSREAAAEARSVWDWDLCDHCGEPLHEEESHGYPPDADHESVCSTCFDVAMER